MKTIEDIRNLIQKGEGQRVEFKSTLRVDIKTNKAEKYIEHSILKTLAAFLNSEGGILLIGIEDDKNIIGLELDFNSFNKSDNLDEFQKHFDNLISKSLGNRFHRYLEVEFFNIDNKIICTVTIKGKSEDPVFITNDSKQDIFYIRRQASTIDLKPSETLKYVQEHWKQSSFYEKSHTRLPSSNFFKAKENFNNELLLIISDKESVFYKEIKEHWNCYSLIDDSPFLQKLIQDFLPKSIDFGLLLIISDFVKRHLYNDQQAKYIYNQSHIYLHKQEDQGYDMLVYNHIRFIGLLYATAILNKVDINTVSNNYRNMQSIFSSMIEGIIDNMDYKQDDYEKEYPTNFHWLIGEIFSFTANWLTTFNEEENFVKDFSYLDFIPFNMRLCFSELYKGMEQNKISEKFIVSKYYYSAITQYFSPFFNDSLRESMENNIIINIPNQLIRPVLKFSLDEEYAIRFDDFANDNYRLVRESERNILARLRTFLKANNKL